MRTCGDYTPLIATWMVSLDFIIGAASSVAIVTSGYVDDFMQDTGGGISNTCTQCESHNTPSDCIQHPLALPLITPS